jgi:hypothetical protein
MAGGYTWGGIDVGTPGIAPGGGVLGRAGGGNARAATSSPAPAGGSGQSSGSSSSSTGHMGGVPVVATLLGFAGVLFALWLLRRNSSHLQANTFGVNWYGVLVLALVVVLGVNILKIVANKFPLGPLTTVINAV